MSKWIKDRINFKSAGGTPILVLSTLCSTLQTAENPRYVMGSPIVLYYFKDPLKVRYLQVGKTKEKSTLKGLKWIRNDFNFHERAERVT